MESPFRCADGTRYGQCAAIGPKLCEEGNLVDNCGRCGCPLGYGCNTTSGSCFLADMCSDGTAWGMCSTNTPYICVNGTLAGNCTLCGCPADTVCNETTDECYMVHCILDSDCPEGYCFGPYCRDRKELGHSCARDVFCKSGHCVSSRCVFCISDSECPTSETCSGGACKPVSCPDGVVRQHECFTYDCETDQDCPSHQECLNRYCSALFCLENQVIEDHGCSQRPFVLPEYALYLLTGLAAIIVIAAVRFYRGRKPKPKGTPEEKEEEE